MFSKGVFIIVCLEILLELNTVVTVAFCKNPEIAVRQLKSYYKWYYRMWYFWRTSTICSMDESQKRRLCAKIIKACIKAFKQVELSKLEIEVKGTAKCNKEPIKLPASGEEKSPWTSKKNMFLCPKQKICFEETCYPPTDPIYISAGGLINTSLVFRKPKPEDKYVEIIHFVENIEFETIDGKLIDVKLPPPPPDKPVEPTEPTKET